MYHIATLNNISSAGLQQFDEKYTIDEHLAGAAGILVRSQDMHSIAFDPALLAIARAGAGVNNIPLDTCADQGIVVFNTPGANANAVKELVISALLFSARNIPEAVSWTNGLTENIGPAVEAGKKQFAGTEIMGKTLGIIGMGAIGAMVASAAKALGMHVIGYDPYLSVTGALAIEPGIPLYQDLSRMLPLCDVVTIHTPYMESTRESINADLFSAMNEGTILLNFARDKLIQEDDLLEAMERGIIAKYVTDFPTEKLHGKPGIISIPHLGASTVEAEENCARMAAEEIMDYLENGNITNSVNFPSVSLGPMRDEDRVAILTRGVDDPAALLAELLADQSVNAIAGGTRGDYGYALASTLSILEEVPSAPGLLRARIITAEE